MDRQKTGALIAQMRKERGLTQRELAEQLQSVEPDFQMSACWCPWPKHWA